MEKNKNIELGSEKETPREIGGKVEKKERWERRGRERRRHGGMS